VFEAAGCGHVAAIRTLHELGADINTPNNHGCTPLLAAASKGHQKVVKLLRKLGADMNEESIVGSAVDVAQAFGHDAVAEKLSKYTACCACCQKKKGTADVKLLACSRCLKTYYCSSQCQKQDWKLHKKTCAAAAAAADQS
jgi:hypothetical protein